MFIHHGFNNWKKALEKFRDHECSNMHKETTAKLAAKARGVGIDAQLSVQLRNDQEHHRKMLLKLLKQFNIFHTKDCHCVLTEKIQNLLLVTFINYYCYKLKIAQK